MLSFREVLSSWRKEQKGSEMHWPSQSHLHPNFIPPASEISFFTFKCSPPPFLFCQNFDMLDQPRDLYFWSLKVPTQNTAAATMRDPTQSSAVAVILLEYYLNEQIPVVFPLPLPSRLWLCLFLSLSFSQRVLSPAMLEDKRCLVSISSLDLPVISHILWYLSVYHC